MGSATTDTLSQRARLTLNLTVIMRAHTRELVNLTSFGFSKLSLAHRRTAAVATRADGIPGLSGFVKANYSVDRLRRWDFVFVLQIRDLLCHHIYPLIGLPIRRVTA